MNKERIQEIVNDIVEYTEGVTIAKMIVKHPSVFRADEFIKAQNERIIKLSESRIKELTAELVLLSSK